MRNGKIKLAVLASGGGSNLQAIIDKIQREEIPAQIALVISDKEQAFALERARKNHIRAEFVNPKGFPNKKAYEEAIKNLLAEEEIHLVVLAGYMRLVGQTLLGEYKNRIINIHPALLPAFPGAHGQRDAWEYGVRYSGCTVHFVDEGMDTGPIILQAIVPVLQSDQVEDLSARILKEEHKILPEAIKLFAEGRLSIEGRKVRILE